MLALWGSDRSQWTKLFHRTMFWCRGSGHRSIDRWKSCILSLCLLVNIFVDHPGNIFGEGICFFFGKPLRHDAEEVRRWRIIDDTAVMALLAIFRIRAVAHLVRYRYGRWHPCRETFRKCRMAEVRQYEIGLRASQVAGVIQAEENVAVIFRTNLEISALAHIPCLSFRKAEARC